MRVSKQAAEAFEKLQQMSPHESKDFIAETILRQSADLEKTKDRLKYYKAENKRLRKKLSEIEDQLAYASIEL